MASVTSSDTRSPWHPGELEIQRRAGVAARMDDIGRRVIRRYLPEQHRGFYAQLPLVVLGTVDTQGNAWATLRAGRPGFLRSPEPTSLHISAGREPDDPADAGMEDGDALGLLGIDLATRRRNRLNGRIHRDSAYTFSLSVDQSYGNCPKYIRQRDPEFLRDPAVHSPVPAQHLAQLDARAQAMITGADSFFVASYVTDRGQRQVDVSHRGGNPGFVRVAGGVLTIPDFAGNLFFNTLGNLLLNPKAGLVFPDFETGDLLQLSGDAEVILDSPEIAAFQGAERLWRFRPRRIVYRAGALPIRWTARPDGRSPHSLLTGNWDEAARRLRAAELTRT